MEYDTEGFGGISAGPSVAANELAVAAIWTGISKPRVESKKWFSAVWKS